MRTVFVDYEARPRYWLDGPLQEPNTGTSPCGEIQMTEPACCTLQGPSTERTMTPIIFGGYDPQVMSMVRESGTKFLHEMYTILLIDNQRKKARQFRLNKMYRRTHGPR